LLNDAGKVIFGDCLDDFLDERVLMEGEVFFLDLFVELWTTSFSNQECFCRSSTFQGNLCGILQLTDEQILLDDALYTLIPVGVSRDCLLHDVLLGMRGSGSTAIMFSSTTRSRGARAWAAALVDFFTLAGLI
jgi:hypothetical protein